MRSFLLYSLSLASAATLSALAGAAQAQPSPYNSSISLYGVADAALVFDKTSNGTLRRVESGQAYGSRVGFSGTEDLGSGAQAQFKLEMGTNLDTGTSAQGGRLFGRQAWVGLGKKGFGQLRLGRTLVPEYILTSFHADPSYDGHADQSSYLWGDRLYFNTDNAITYDGQFGPVKVEAQYSTVMNGQEVAGSRTGRGLGLFLDGQFGPAQVLYAFQRTTLASGRKDTHDILGVVYTVADGFTLHGMAGRFDDKADARHVKTLVGVRYAIGRHAVYASFNHSHDRRAGAVDADASMLAVGGDYALSKRTVLYGGVSRIDNERNARFAQQYVVTNALGDDPSQLSLGIRHSF